MKNKPCAFGKRHKWVHSHNKVFQTGSGAWVRVSLMGVYRCACGEMKKGEYVPDYHK